jgi:hypothetical protein
MKRFFYVLACGLIALLVQAPSVAAENSIEIETARIEKNLEDYVLFAKVTLNLTRGLENALMSGVPIYFTTDVEMARPRWYWFNEKAADTKQTVRIAYNVLTRQFVGAIGEGLQRNFRTLDEALSLVRSPPRWVVAEKKELSVGQTYEVAVRVRLDISQLPKPFQINAINNRDWRLSSDWKRFSYTAQ